MALGAQDDQSVEKKWEKGEAFAQQYVLQLQDHMRTYRVDASSLR